MPSAAAVLAAATTLFFSVVFEQLGVLPQSGMPSVTMTSASRQPSQGRRRIPKRRFPVALTSLYIGKAFLDKLKKIPACVMPSYDACLAGRLHVDVLVADKKA